MHKYVLRLSSETRRRSESLTSVEARSAHQLRPVGTGPQQSVQRNHWSVVAAASRPARQAEALVGVVSLGRAVGGGPDHGAHATGDAPQIQVPVDRVKTRDVCGSWKEFLLHFHFCRITLHTLLFLN